MENKFAWNAGWRTFWGKMWMQKGWLRKVWRLLLKVQPAADLRWIHGVQFGAQHLVCCQRHSHGVQLLILAQASVGEIDGWGCEYMNIESFPFWKCWDMWKGHCASFYPPSVFVKSCSYFSQSQKNLINILNYLQGRSSLTHLALSYSASRYLLKWNLSAGLTCSSHAYLAKLTMQCVCTRHCRFVEHTECGPHSHSSALKGESISHHSGIW